MTQPMAAHRCIYLDPTKGYRLCNAPVAPGGMLLCLKHRAEAELRYRERQDQERTERQDREEP